jgi:hypothetical protein
MSVRLLLLYGVSFLILYSCDVFDAGSQQAGETYYVSLQGDDANPGTKAKPWKSISKINESDFQPRSEILFEGGAVFKGNIKLNQSESDMPVDNMTISSFGEGRATIDAENGLALSVVNGSKLTIKQLNFKGSGRKKGNTNNGVHLINCDSLNISHLEVSGFQHSGLLVQKSNAASITHVHAHDNGFSGILVTGKSMNHPLNYDNTNLYIGYCIAENNPGDPTVLTNHSGNGILAASVDGGIIEHCEAFNNGWDMPWHDNGPVGIWIYDCNDITMQYNISHDNKTAKGAEDGGGFDFDGGVSNSVMQYNISYNNEGPGIGLFEYGAAKTWKNNVVRFNLSVDDGITTQGALRIWKAEGKGEMYGCDIYNNTIINNNKGNSAAGILTNVPGIRFFNNIFVYDEEFIWFENDFGTERFLGNLYWDIGKQNTFLGFPSFEHWAKSTGHEMKENQVLGLLADPGLNQNISDPPKLFTEFLTLFYPLLGAPGIDHGLRLDTLMSDKKIGLDLAGNAIPSGTQIDIGAIEFQVE